ncbi:Glutathione S-transferase GST-6.0 [Pantoea agglomerans]|uniref:Glutathione S-transferase GST-6.0 n=1 Tax=Enterobacter agglomerans TaxID=549 RepID=A0A379LTM4_ENTAG|nr:Glutathione S-transferase GST-6.0 [Pantoea agglomerans]
MKLYYAPDTCSLSPHIVLRELALEFELVKVDNRSKLTSDGRDFRLINPQGLCCCTGTGRRADTD